MKSDESAPGAGAKDPYDGWLEVENIEVLPPSGALPPPVPRDEAPTGGAGGASAEAAGDGAGGAADADQDGQGEKSAADEATPEADAGPAPTASAAHRASGRPPSSAKLKAPTELSDPSPDDELALPAALEDSPLGRLRSVLGHARSGWRAQRCGQAAAAFALYGALALCGLVALVAAILRGAGQLGPGGPLLRGAAWRLLPAAPELLTEQLAAAFGRPSAWALGGGGALLMLAAGLPLFLQIEALFSEAFAAERRRPLLQRLLLFNAALTLLPVPLALWLWQSAAQLAAPDAAGPLLACLACSAGALALLVQVLPAAAVPWRVALLGGLGGGLLIEGGKLALLVGARALLGRPGVYGAFLALPLLLGWLTYGWLAALWGLQLAQAALRHRQIDLAALSRAVEEEEERDVLVSELLVLRLLRDLAVHFAGGGKALPAAVLRQRHGLPPRVLQRIMQRLEDRDLVLTMNGAYLPARPLDRVPLDEALQAFTERCADGGALDRLLGEAEAERRRQLARRTLADLI